MTQRAATAAPFRRERATTLALLCGPGGAGAHVAAGGDVPAATTVLVATALVGVAALVLGGRRLGLPTLLALAGSGQLVLHLAMAGGGDHGHHPQPMATDPAMVAAHAAIAVVVAAVATGMEASWWALARAAVARLLPVLPRVAPSGPVAPGPLLTPYARRLVLRHEPDDVASGRGPPTTHAVVVIA